MAAEYGWASWYQETQHKDTRAGRHLLVCAKWVLSCSGDAFCHDCSAETMHKLHKQHIIAFFRGTDAGHSVQMYFPPSLVKRYGWPARLSGDNFSFPNGIQSTKKVTINPSNYCPQHFFSSSLKATCVACSNIVAEADQQWKLLSVSAWHTIPCCNSKSHQSLANYKTTS